MLLYREGRDCLCLAGGAEENVCFLPAGGLGWKCRDGGINGNVYGGRQGQKSCDAGMKCWLYKKS